LNISILVEFIIMGKNVHILYIICELDWTLQVQTLSSGKGLEYFTVFCLIIL
jgi:hypothetical protein